MGYLPLLSYAPRAGAECPLATPQDSVESNGPGRALGIPQKASRDSSHEESTGTTSDVKAQSNERDESCAVPSTTMQRKQFPALTRSAKPKDATASRSSGAVKKRDTNASSASGSVNTRERNASSSKTRGAKARGAYSASGSPKKRETDASSPSSSLSASGKQGASSEAAQRRAVLRLQRHLLDVPRCTEGQLAAVCSLLTGPELDDVAVERSLAQRCGNLLCGETRKDTQGTRKGSKLGQLKKISMKEGTVHDAEVLGRFCSSQCMRESQAAVASLPREREGVMSAQELARVLLSVGCLPQAAAGTPQGAAGTPQAVADGMKKGAGTPQSDREGVTAGASETPRRHGSAREGASAGSHCPEAKAGSPGSNSEAQCAPVSSQSTSTQSHADPDQNRAGHSDKAVESRAREASSVQIAGPTQGVHAKPGQARAKAMPKAKAEERGKGKGKGTASKEREWASSVMSSVKEKWGDTDTAEESARSGLSEEGGSEDRRSEKRRAAGEGRKPWGDGEGDDAEGRGVQRPAGDEAGDSQVWQVPGESDAIEGYTPARRVPSEPPSLGGSSKSGGARRGTKKKGEVKGSKVAGVGSLWGRAGEGRMVTWGPVQVHTPGDAYASPRGRSKCRVAAEGGAGPVREGEGSAREGDTLEDGKGDVLEDGEGDTQGDEEGVGEVQGEGRERSVRGEEWEDVEKEEGEDDEDREEEEDSDGEEEGEEAWERREEGASKLSGDSPFRFGEYFWQDDCCWLEEEPPDSFLSDVPSSVSLLLALQHMASAETVLLLTTGVPLLLTHPPSASPSCSPNNHQQGSGSGSGGGDGGAGSGSSPPPEYQRPTRALVAEDGGWEYAPRVCPDPQRADAIGRALTSCVGRALPGVLRDFGVSSRSVSLHALEASVRELVKTFSLVLPLPSFSQAQWRLLAALFVHALSRAAFPGIAPALEGVSEGKGNGKGKGREALERICREASCPYESYLSLVAFLVPSLRNGPGDPLVHPLPSLVPGQAVSASSEVVAVGLSTVQRSAHCD